MSGIVTISGVQQNTYSQATTRGQIRPDGGVQLHSSDEVSLQTAEPFNQTLVVVGGDAVKVARDLGNVPSAHSEAGGVAQYLSGVSDERFYGLSGKPNYNGLLADLARQSFATFPDSLEDGRLPNLSTFQRAVATEGRKREQTLPTVLYMHDPEARVMGAIGTAIERSAEQGIRSYNGVATSETPVQGQLALDLGTGAFAQTEEKSSSVTPYNVTVETEVSGPRPSIADAVGGLSKFLTTVPQELFYNDKGDPNFNKIFAGLARFNGATGPESLEDGTLPNISTFQRAVSGERARREKEAAAMLATLLVGTGFTGPQGQRVLDQAARMAGIG